MSGPDEFATRVAAVARKCKGVASESELERQAVAIGRVPGTLVHVCRLHDNATLVARLGSWRAANQEGFFTRFEVTQEGTALWLARILEDDERLFFLVRDAGREIVGHAGLTVVSAADEEIEVDNVVRGSPDAPRGLMTAALETALSWAQARLAPRVLSVRVLEDNERAVQLYRRAGFESVSRHELRLHRDGRREELRPLESGDHDPADGAYLRMVRATR